MVVGSIPTVAPHTNFNLMEVDVRVEILETQERLGIRAGEIYEATPYWLDPQEKVTLLSRVPDGFDPECNQYIDQVRVIK